MGLDGKVCVTLTVKMNWDGRKGGEERGGGGRCQAAAEKRERKATAHQL